MELEDRTIVLRQGTCLWMRPMRRYLAEHDPNDPLCVTYVHFTPRDAKGRALLAHGDLPDEAFTVHDATFFGIVMDKIVALNRRPDAEASAQASLLLRALLADLLFHHQEDPEPQSRYRAPLEAQIARIYEQPAHPWTVRGLARELHVSPDHYTRIFHRMFDTAPRALIQQARLQRACHMLLETSLSVSEVAEQTGYADVFQFSRLFKRQMKVPPSQWRAGSGIRH